MREGGQGRLFTVLRKLSDRPEDAAEDAAGIAAAESALGMRLPQDYVDFIHEFGGGSIEDETRVEVPYSTLEPGMPNSVIGGTEAVRNSFLRARRVDDRFSPERLVRWGGDSNFDLLWNTSEPNPDDWPVVLMENPGEMIDLGFGMREFILRRCLGGLPSPLSDYRLGAPASFLHWREEIRRWESGLDPWEAC
ncbi:SMI1/KNR4 family protein [Kitasatospora cineracea]|uniref:SMI1/KNR4 family protein n=1 Tax=Kitasatospora cineracea TaxID=88074 RepID=UPI00343F15B6